MLSWLLFSLSLCFYFVLYCAAVEEGNYILGNAKNNSTTDMNDDACELYLVRSSLPNVGRRVLIGNDSVGSHSFLFYSPTIFIPENLSHSSQLSNYVFGSKLDGYAVFMIGPGSLMNHSPFPNVDHYWGHPSGANPLLFKEEHSASYYSYLMTNGQSLKKGDEMLVSYGDTWFEARALQRIALEEASSSSVSSFSAEGSSCDSSIPDASSFCAVSHGASDKESTSVAEKKESTESEVSVCLDDVYIAPSLRSNAGNGLFAKKSFHKGDLITVSPVLLLSKTEILSYLNDTILMNYCFSEKKSQVFVFPVNFAGMMNHYEDMNYFPSSYKPNVEIQWFDWNSPIYHLSNSTSSSSSSSFSAEAVVVGYSDSFKQLLSSSVSNLITFPFAPLDLAYYAKDGIEQGEELTINYGKSWKQAYSSSSAFSEKRSHEVNFRHWIETPEDLFPKQWFVESLSEHILFGEEL
jgi:hypothetical protein